MVDMWAFGCTFYEVLHIKPMFTGTMFQLINKIGNVELQSFEAECPKEFKDIIMQCFEAKPGNRPSALELIETVENVRFNLQRMSKIEPRRPDVQSNQSETLRQSLPTKLRYQKMLIMNFTCFKLEENSRLWWRNLGQFN